MENGITDHKTNRQKACPFLNYLHPWFFFFIWRLTGPIISFVNITTTTSTKWKQLTISSLIQFLPRSKEISFKVYVQIGLTKTQVWCLEAILLCRKYGVFHPDAYMQREEWRTKGIANGQRPRCHMACPFKFGDSVQISLSFFFRLCWLEFGPREYWDRHGKT